MKGRSGSPDRGIETITNVFDIARTRVPRRHRSLRHENSYGTSSASATETNDSVPSFLSLIPRNPTRGNPDVLLTLSLGSRQTIN